MTARPGRWEIEDLLASPAALGAAHAAARFHDDLTARRALNELAAAVAVINRNGTSAGDADDGCFDGGDAA